MTTTFQEASQYASPPLPPDTPAQVYSFCTPEMLLRLHEMQIDVESLKNAHYDFNNTDSFRDSVLAIHSIVMKKLYRIHLLSLEDYFHSRFNMSRAQVYRLLDCAQVLLDLQIPLDPSFVLAPFPVRQRVAKTIKELAPTRFLRQLLWSTVLKTCSQRSFSECKWVKKTASKYRLTSSVSLSSLSRNDAMHGSHSYFCPSTIDSTPFHSSLNEPFSKSSLFVQDITSKDVKKAWVSLYTDPSLSSLLPQPPPSHHSKRRVLNTLHPKHGSCSPIQAPVPYYSTTLTPSTTNWSPITDHGVPFTSKSRTPKLTKSVILNRPHMKVTPQLSFPSVSSSKCYPSLKKAFESYSDSTQTTACRIGSTYSTSYPLSPSSSSSSLSMNPTSLSTLATSATTYTCNTKSTLTHPTLAPPPVCYSSSSSSSSSCGPKDLYLTSLRTSKTHSFIMDPLPSPLSSPPLPLDDDTPIRLPSIHHLLDIADGTTFTRPQLPLLRPPILPLNKPTSFS